MATRDDTPYRIGHHITTVLAGVPLEHLQTLHDLTASLRDNRATTKQAKHDSALLVHLVEQALYMAEYQANVRRA